LAPEDGGGTKRGLQSKNNQKARRRSSPKRFQALAKPPDYSGCGTLTIEGKGSEVGEHARGKQGKRPTRGVLLWSGKGGNF